MSFEDIDSLLSGKESPGRLLFRVLGDRVQDIEGHGGDSWLRLPESGVAIMFKDVPTPGGRQVALIPTAVHLYGPGKSDGGEYRGDLPGGIRFGDPRASLCSKLGEPGSVGGGETGGILYARTPLWVKYPVGALVMHLQLDDRDRLELVTLMPRSHP